MDNPKVEVRKKEGFGKGLYAKDWIYKGEIVGSFRGKVRVAEAASKLDVYWADHAIQIGENEWSLPLKNGGSIHMANHSCNPNCGMKGPFDIVAMNDIEQDEEITWDYEMSEDSTWRMRCKCGAAGCRGVIGAFANMPDEVREKYAGYISDWLVEKYDL